MFNNAALDVVIGLVFIFLLYSMLASIVQEIVATKLGFRAKILERAILRMLEDGKTTTRFPLVDSFKGLYQLLFRSNTLKNKKFATAFYTHPLLKYLAENNWFSKPAYIKAENFSKALIDLLNGVNPSLNGPNILRIQQSVESGRLAIKLPAIDEDNPANKNYHDQQENEQKKEKDINPETQLFLRSLLAESGGDVEKFKALLEKWFNDTMERATGWYKRYTQYILLITGLIIAYVFNVDSIAIAKILSTNDKARAQIVQMAISANDKYKSVVDSQRNGRSPRTDGNDTLLQQTYQVVLEDVNKASSIMGLGRPWKDSCAICKDSTKNNDFEKRVDSARKFPAIIPNSLKIEQERLNKRIAEVRDTMQTGLLLELEDQKSKNDSLIAFLVAKQAEQQKLIKLKERCAYISKARDGHWFKYGPNQAGGWETLLGWLITALAISLGAPFWFDLLSKLVRVRSANKAKDSEDPASPPSAAAPAQGAQTININTNTGEEAVG